MKTVLFVPGFKENLASRNYSAVIKTIESKGYAVKFVPINWARTTINDWVNELDNEYNKFRPSDVVLAGFSFGSMTAFLSAAKSNPSELWLFSFSPYFAEDISQMKKIWLSNIGHRRADVFRSLNFHKIAVEINCKTLIFVGEIEAKKYPLMRNLAKSANKEIKNSELIWVKDTDHDVSAPNYIKAIKLAIDPKKK